MNNTDTTAGMPLDVQSEVYLTRIANSVEYVKREKKPARLCFDERDVRLNCQGSVKVDGKPVSLFRFPARHVTYLDKDDFSDDVEPPYFAYAADWPMPDPSSMNGGYIHETFIFKSEPTGADIQKARRVATIMEEIENGEFDQYYNCHDCGKRVHWTESRQESEQDSVCFRRRIFLARNNVCRSCTSEPAMERSQIG